MSAQPETTVENPDEPLFDEQALKTRAYRRSWLCPGAGFALIGRPAMASATYLASIGSLLAFAWLGVMPGWLPLWATIGSFLLVTILWLGEQVSVKRLGLRSPAPAVLADFFLASTCVMWLIGVGAVVVVVATVGAVYMAGTGMVPTFERGERVVYHRHLDPETLKPGTVVIYRNADDSGWGEPGWLMIGRILAGPGNRLSIADGHYLVNGNRGPAVAPLGRATPVLRVPEAPESRSVPEGCYFLVQDNATASLDSRVLSWVPQQNLISTRMWLLSSRGIFKPVE